MKTIISSTFVSSLIVSAAYAAPMVSIGDNVDMFFKLSTSVKSDDNITASPTNAIDDVVFTVTPGVEFDFFRGETLWDAVLNVDTAFIRYADNSEYDASNLGVNFRASYSSPVAVAGLGVSYKEDQQKTQRQSGQLIEVETTAVQGSVRYFVSEKLSFRVSPSYTIQDYVGAFGANLPDKDTFKVDLKGYYGITPKYDITVGLAYIDQDIDDIGGRIGGDPEDLRLTVGVDGELLPKVTGNFDLGYTERTFSKGSSEGRETLFVGSNLTWMATQKIFLSSGISQDFESTAAGNAIESFRLTFNARYQYNNFWGVSSFVRFVNDDYLGQAREDEVTSFGVTASYSPNAFLNFGGQIYYLENDSNIGLDYDNTVFEVSASLRY